jgi:hypothetical protein
MTRLTDVTAARLLDAWERGLFAAPPERPLLLLEAVTNQDRASLAALPLGARDRLLLELRQSALGSRIQCESRCPACDERVEFGVRVPALECETAGAASDACEIEHGDWRVAFRLPTTADLIGCAEGSRDAARRIVLRCVLAARRGDAQVAPDTLPDAVVEAVAERCADLDPQADIELELACPTCGHGWHSPFDIAAFLWNELESWATRMLDDIHVIASRYGWSEAAILNLSPSRRRYYLERLQA